MNKYLKRLWRRRRDSNPRDPSEPTPLAGERLRPLGHVSVNRYIGSLEPAQVDYVFHISKL